MTATTIVGTWWKSADRREERWVYVRHVSDGYAHVVQCDSRGVVFEGSRGTRIRLDANGGLRGYRRWER